MAGYLTPDALPTDTTCRALFMPNDPQFIANITGALQTLTLMENWTQFGTLTPQQSADALVDMFNKFCFREGICRMIGEVFLYAGPTNPDPFHLLLCDGTSLSNVTYPDLYIIIGNTYGGTGPTDFLLPDLRGRVAMGESGAHPLGEALGAETITLTTAEMPSHTHADSGHTHAESTALPNVTTIGAGAPQPTAVPGIGVTGVGFAAITNTGGDGSHANMQPYLTLDYYIVVLP